MNHTAIGGLDAWSLDIGSVVNEGWRKPRLQGLSKHRFLNGIRRRKQHRAFCNICATGLFSDGIGLRIAIWMHDETSVQRECINSNFTRCEGAYIAESVSNLCR